MIKQPLAFLAIAFFALMAVGCCPVTKLNVTVELDDALRQQLQSAGGRSIVVDLVGITPNEHQRWQNYSMTKYWEANDPMRNSVATYTMTFDPSKTQAQTLSSSDPIWQKWLAGANDQDKPKLYVLAQLPGTWSSTDDKPADQDPRRQILPLGACRWETINVHLTIHKNELRTDTQQKGDKAGT